MSIEDGELLGASADKDEISAALGAVFSRGQNVWMYWGRGRRAVATSQVVDVLKNELPLAPCSTNLDDKALQRRESIAFAALHGYQRSQGGLGALAFPSMMTSDFGGDGVQRRVRYGIKRSLCSASEP